MPAVVRVGDMSAGHPHCYPPTPAVSGSPNVFVNGKALCRVGDSISCGDTMAQGSPNVFAGG